MTDAWVDPDIEVTAPSLAPAAIEIFKQDVASLMSVYRSVIADLDLPTAKTTLLLVDAFDETVDTVMPARLRGDEGPAFSSTREGGVVAAKTLDLTGDMSEAVVIFNAAHWVGAAEDQLARMQSMYLVAHELAHVVIDRTLHVSGALAGIVAPSRTGLESRETPVGSSPASIVPMFSPRS